MPEDDASGGRKLGVIGVDLFGLTLDDRPGRRFRPVWHPLGWLEAVRRVMGIKGETPRGGREPRLSPAGMSYLMDKEKFRRLPYQDAGGRPTVGYGHLIRPGEKDAFEAPLTLEQGVALLKDDLAVVEAGVEAAVKVPLNQHQYDALVIFAFNVGLGAFEKSTLLRQLNAGNLAAAAREFDRWVYVRRNGVPEVVRGLEIRRAQERAMFERGEYGEEKCLIVA